ncbi:hypothetical protein DDE18_18945 [Nocardioides gansuensis]|uniref:Uncharacterized protein n=1 Tax=Nocardioides gansuensis TaxID=2138300 RepID=A0A2T8F681_9ACTN|nr:hypothetical protein [Nocardioides gansuensis]PVG81226.1 hypothetical protein DDE18_18945 [Nocardioides gansuensis]
MPSPNRPVLLAGGVTLLVVGVALLGWGASHLWTRIDIPGARPRFVDIGAFLGGFLVAGGGLHLLLLWRDASRAGARPGAPLEDRVDD